MSEINLQKFCILADRSYLTTPFFAGEFSYGTNGKIAVRVARRPDLIENNEVPENIRAAVDKLFAGHATATFRKPAAVTLPVTSTGVCDECDGRGTKYFCPSCRCSCATCEGSGEKSNDGLISIEVGSAPFSLRFVRLMLSLPDLEISEVSRAGQPLPFRFAGGEGILMGRTCPSVEHLNVRL